MSHLSLFQTSCGLGLPSEDFSGLMFSKMFQQPQREVYDEESTEMNSFECSKMKTEPRTSTTHKPRKDNLGDRFIPFRNTKRMEVGSFLLSSQESSTSQEEDGYSKLITEGLINTPLKEEAKLFKTDVRINQFKQSSSMPANLTDQLSFLYDKSLKNYQTKKPPRTLPQNPEKILDAPELVNDYYLNLLDWGNNNILAVCLGQSVYLWNAMNSEINQLLTTKESDSYVSSVSWSTRSNVVAVGTSTNLIQVWDAERGQLVRNVYGHDQRVSSLNWNGCILSSGSRDATIINHDLRMPNHIINRYIHHSSEVCGLKWSPDGSQLASGANDNTLMIWDLSYNTPRHILREHTAAVKAVAWCPWQKNLLASGGGTNDKTIKFWNTDAGCMVQSLNCNTQVCSLIWNPNEKEIVSSHGFSNATEDNSKSYIRVWKYPSMSIVGELKGHEDRVLHLALSPDNETVVSAGADERLCFWKLFEAPYSEKKTQKSKMFMNDLR